MTHEIRAQDKYERFWKSLKGGFSSDTRHYSSQTPDPNVVDFFAYLKNKNIHSGNCIDLGGGNGRHSVYAAMQGFNTTLVDFSNEAIKLAKTNASEHNVSITTLQTSVLNTPFQENSFDIAIDGGCLHHLRVSQWKAYLENLNRILKPGGYYFLLTFSNDSGYIPKFTPKSLNKNWILRNNHYSYFFDKERLTQLFSKDFLFKKYYIWQKPDAPLRYCISILKKKS